MSVDRSVSIVKAATGNVLGSLKIDHHPDRPVLETASRLEKAVHHLEELRASAADPSLRYEVAIAPLYIPYVWSHIPEFLTTRKEAALADAEKAAEVLGRDLESRTDIAAYNACCDATLASFLTAAGMTSTSAAAAAAAARSVRPSGFSSATMSDER